MMMMTSETCIAWFVSALCIVRICIPHGLFIAAAASIAIASYDHHHKPVLCPTNVSLDYVRRLVRVPSLCHCHGF